MIELTENDNGLDRFSYDKTYIFNNLGAAPRNPSGK